MLKLTSKELIAAICDEARDLHHNASLLGKFPDFDSDDEAELFWEQLYFEVETLSSVLAEDLKQFGFDVQIQSYGRNGATIAPVGWYIDNAITHGFNWDLVDTDRGVDAYFYNYRLWKALCYINEFWEKQTDNVGTWWKATLEDIHERRQEELKHRREAISLESPRVVATLTAALRLWQESHEKLNQNDPLWDVATNAGRYVPLSTEEANQVVEILQEGVI